MATTDDYSNEPGLCQECEEKKLHRSFEGKLYAHTDGKKLLEGHYRVEGQMEMNPKGVEDQEKRDDFVLFIRHEESNKRFWIKVLGNSESGRKLYERFGEGTLEKEGFIFG